MGGLRYLSFCLLASCALGASVSDVFETSFSTAYSEGLCKQNSVRFLERLEREGHSPSRFSLVKIANKGISTFGLVNAEKARSWVQGNPVAEEKNWYEHWVVLGDEGTVYDFDFTPLPTPTPFVRYVEEMFLKEPECSEAASLELCGGREDKLEEYELTFFDGELLKMEKPVPTWKGSLSQAIQKF